MIRKKERHIINAKYTQIYTHEREHIRIAEKKRSTRHERESTNKNEGIR